MSWVRALLTIAAASLALAGPGPAWARKPSPAPALAPGEDAQLREIARRGALLYAYDQAAWHGTDDMIAKLPDYQSRVGGWIVDGPAEAPELVFFDRDYSNPHALFVARFRDGKMVSGEVVGAAELSAERRRLIAAREGALAALGGSDVTRCTEAAMNSVVLPPAAPGEPTLVYVLTPQRVMNAVPFGGHYLIPVDAAGRPGPVQRFTKSCLEMDLAARPGGRPEMMMITHLLGPLPTEIHVFSSLVAHLPVMVATSDGRLWAVDGTAVSLVGKVGR